MRKNLAYFTIFLLILAYVFRSLLFNLTTHLTDWFDYPYIIWVIFQNIQKIKTLDFTHYFDTNAFYPHKMTLLFSDILLPQSLIALPFSFFTDNPITVINIVVILTFVLNYISSFLFWQQLFKRQIIGFLGALFTFFSPFFHLHEGYFQMQSYWLFFLSLYFLYRHEEEEKTKYLILVAIFLSLQFLASVYLSIFLIAVIFIFYFCGILFKKDIILHLKKLALIIILFVLIDGVFIKGYFDMKEMYKVKRDYGEYVSYSAHLSDYLFTTNINSLIHQSSAMGRWNRFDKHMIGAKAAFPGFLLFFLFTFGLIPYLKIKRKIDINLDLNEERSLFLILVLTGLAFSLGPILSFNGVYGQIPTPYTLLIKLPVLGVMRSPSRWSFIFYLGIIYFALYFIKKLNLQKRYNQLLIVVIVVFFILEYMPINIKTHQENYLSDDYKILKTICNKEKKVVLELPVTHFGVKSKSGIAGGLNYITKTQLASLYHGCYLVNGYSGYDLPELIKLDISISQYLKERNYKLLVAELKKLRVDYVKVKYDLINLSNNNLRRELSIYNGLKGVASSTFSIY